MSKSPEVLGAIAGGGVAAKSPDCSNCSVCPLAGGGCPLKPTANTIRINSFSELFSKSGTGLNKGTFEFATVRKTAGGFMPSARQETSETCSSCKKANCDCPFSVKNRLN